jgi:hypothetical protein
MDDDILERHLNLRNKFERSAYEGDNAMREASGAGAGDDEDEDDRKRIKGKESKTTSKNQRKIKAKRSAKSDVGKTVIQIAKESLREEEREVQRAILAFSGVSANTKSKRKVNKFRKELEY